MIIVIAKTYISLGGKNDQFLIECWVKGLHFLLFCTTANKTYAKINVDLQCYNWRTIWMDAYITIPPPRVSENSHNPYICA